MPRPPDVTEERIAAWLAGMGPPKERALKKTPVNEAAMDEAACACSWLWEKLEAETQLAHDARKRACEAAGQICFGRDPWAVVEKALLICTHGDMPAPGMKLAKDLTEGKLDSIFGPGPDLVTKDGIARMKKAMGIDDLSKLVEMSGSATVEEAKAKIQSDIDAMEKEGYGR